MTPVELLQKWSRKAKAFRDAHYSAASRLRRMHYVLGIPTIVLSAFVGTTVFAALEREVNVWARLVIAVTSVTAAVMAALQTFLRFSERAEAHRQAYASFDAVARHIELVLVEHDSVPNMEVTPAFLAATETIRKRLDDLVQAPELMETDRQYAEECSTSEDCSARATPTANRAARTSKKPPMLPRTNR